MNAAAKPVTVNILEKDYLVSCSEDERDQLHTAVSYLNRKMLEVKNAGKVVGTERIAVMAALNIAHELLACRAESDHYNTSVDSTVRRLQTKIEEALAQGVALEM